MFESPVVTQGAAVGMAIGGNGDVMVTRNGRVWPLVAILGFLLTGCTGSPAGVTGPKWDPAAAARQALSENDVNGDQKLSKEELKKSPGLLVAMSSLDRDGDGTISEEELQTGLAEMGQAATALVKVPCSVTHGGRPLEGATVTFVPESFLGGGIKSASGVTGPDGMAIPTVADEELPAEYRGRLKGVPCGIFRVMVTHPSVTVPPKFNTETTIGRVVTRRERETLMINL